MTCANCSGTVGDALSHSTASSKRTPIRATDEGSVEYDPDEVSLAEIHETIEDAGYGAVSDTVTIGISDMTRPTVCRRTTALEDTPGVIASRRTSPPTKRRSGTTPRTRYRRASTTLSRTLVTAGP